MKSIRTAAFSNWGRGPQTPGIFRDPAIPGCSQQKPSGAAFAATALVWPRKSALRLHPCRALSSAPVSTSVDGRSRYTKRVIVADREE
jgi:hypothetical protein